MVPFSHGAKRALVVLTVSICTQLDCVGKYQSSLNSESISSVALHYALFSRGVCLRDVSHRCCSILPSLVTVDFHHQPVPCGSARLLR